MIKVLLFGRFCDLHDKESFEVTLTNDSTSADELRQQLSAEFPDLGRALNETQTLIAVNQEIVAINHLLKAGDEVAFLPPVTGG